MERLIQIAQHYDREALHAKVDEIVKSQPDLGRSGNRLKAIMDHVYAALGDGLAGGMAEVLDRLSAESADNP